MAKNMNNLALILGFVSFSTLLNAGVIYSNLGNPVPFDSGGANTVSFSGTDYGLAFAFPVVTNNYQVTEIDFFISQISGDNTISASIYADNNGLPGAQVYTSGLFADSDLGSGNATEVTIQLASGPVLNVGQTYWFSLDAPSSNEVVWYYNNSDPEIDGPSAINPSPGGSGWTAAGSRDQGAFELDGVIASAPEPVSSSLAVLGLAGVILARKRKAFSPKAL